MNMSSLKTALPNLCLDALIAQAWNTGDEESFYQLNTLYASNPDGIIFHIRIWTIGDSVEFFNIQRTLRTYLWSVYFSIKFFKGSVMGDEEIGSNSIFMDSWNSVKSTQIR